MGIDSGLAAILGKAPSEELEYGFVMECLKGYANPRIKLNHLLKIGALVRIKKGIYVFGSRFARRPFCREALANMIYGPSYVSLEWACQYHQLIPEKVTTVTSMATQRSRRFQTPVGMFTYAHSPLKGFHVGVTLISFSDKQRALVATKEKALVDLLIVRRGAISSKKQLSETLFDDLRVEEDDVRRLSLDGLHEIYTARSHSAIRYLLAYRSEHG